VAAAAKEAAVAAEEEKEAAGLWFSPGTPVSSINKTDIYFFLHF
jgi:hypothetical protein